MTRWTCWACMAWAARWAACCCRSWSRWAPAAWSWRAAPATQFTVQGTGVVAVALWSVAATFVITKLVALLVGLRVDRDSETQGLDFAAHGETGYHVNRR